MSRPQRGRPDDRLTAPMVAVLGKRGRFLVAEPLFGHGPRTAVDPRGSREGDLVLVGSGKRGARVVRALGSPGVARDVVEGLMIDRGLRRAYARRAEDEARFAVGEPFAPRDRVDLTELPTFTIDPEDAKDYDDAISARRERRGVLRLWVHIADVTAFVRPGGALEREAFRRATSVYVPGAVEPMLPELLSSDVCSLVAGEERFAVSVEVELKDGEVRKTAFHRSLIRSDERLTYDRVDRILSGFERAEEPWAEPLELAREAAAGLGERREELELGGAPEPVFEFDSDGHVTGVRHEAETEAHKLIERLMVMANEQVAGYLEDRRLPTLYRVHERPDPASVEYLLEQLATLDIPTPPAPEQMSPQQAADVVAEASRLVASETGPRRQAPRILVLRALKQAYYSPRNVGHAGLGSARYLHFTSPIRRWPDVIAHRALLEGLGIDRVASPSRDLPEAGELCSAAEREAMKIERDADDVCLAFLLERTLAETSPGDEPGFEGEVVGLIPKGAFVRFGDEGFEGLLPVRRLRGWWTLNELGTALEAEGSGARLRLGDPVDVSVERVEAPRGRVDLHLAGAYSPG